MNIKIRFLQISILALLWSSSYAQVPPYCMPAYSVGCIWGDGLSNFQLGTIDEPIPCSGTPSYYHDFTALSTDIDQGETVTLTVIPSYSNVFVDVWIDFNDNNVFDASELVVDDLICTTTGVPSSADLTIPANAPSGSHAMRFRTNWNSPVSNPCFQYNYGNAADFTVNVVLNTPTVSTTAVTSITSNSAESGGEVTDEGGYPVTVRGVCWNTTGTPTITDSFTTDGSGTGVFTSSITGLSINTQYFVRAYATNSDGTGYGNEVSFTTLNCVNPTSGGTIAADQSSCTGFDPAEITSTALPTGHTGNLEYKWQVSTTSSSSGFSDISPTVTSTTYDPSAITTSTWYKRLARVDCSSDWTGAAESNVVAMTIYPSFSAGEIETAGESICSNGDPGIIGSVEDASGGDGSIYYEWEFSTDANFNNSTVYGGVGPTFDPPGGLTATTWYRRWANDGTCSYSPVTSVGVWKVTVYPEFVVGSISDDQSFCQSGTPDELIGVAPTGGNPPYTYQWQSSTDGTNFSDITGAESLNYQPGELTDTTYYQLLQTSVCGTLATNMVTITIHNLCCSETANTCQEPDPANPTGRISDIANGTKIYDNFWDILGGITIIEWWGVMGDGTTLCTDNPKYFEITVYTDNNGNVGEVFATYNLQVTGTETGTTFGTANAPIYRYEVTLPNPVPRLATGWLSIQGNPAETCDFTWINSPNGDGKSIMDGAKAQLNEDFAFSLTADPNIPVSDWAVYIGIFLIAVYIVFRLRKKLAFN